MWSLARHARRIFRGARRINTLSNASRNRFISHNSLISSSPILQLPAISTSKEYSVRAAYKENIDPLLQRLDEDVRRYGRLTRNDVDKLIEGIKIQHDITSSQALLVIRCCGDLVSDELPAERTKLAHELWSTFLNRKVPMDISHYNALLRVYVENNHEFSVDAFLKNLKDQGLEPNRVTYQRFMLHHCQKGDVTEASHILETMRTKNFPLNDAVLDALVLGHVRQGNMEGVNSVLQAMSSAGLNPTANTFKIIMEGHARNGDLENVKKVLEETVSKEIYLTDKDYMDIVQEFADGGHAEHISFMLSQMPRSAGYNQEAINLIYKLLNNGHYDSAIQVFETMAKSTFVTENNVPSYQGAFLIKHLFKTNTPNNLVLSICKKLQENKCAPKASHIAANYALHKGDLTLSLLLFNYMKNEGMPIRQHYFWPLLISSNYKNTLGILKLMVEDFDLNPSVETLREYVLPKLKNNEPVKIIEILRDHGVSSTTAIKSILYDLLGANRLTEASQVVSVYGSKSDLKYLSNNLLKSFVFNPDVGALLNILNISCSEEITLKSSQSENSNEIIRDVKLDQRDLLGKFLIKLIDQKSETIDKKMPSILEGCLSNGLGISNESVEIIKSMLANVSDETNNILVKLTNDDLQPDGYEKINFPPARRNPQQLENLISTLESKGENTNRLQKQLLLAYCRSKEVEKVESLLNTLNENNFVLTSGALASVFDMYVQTGHIEKAMNTKDKILSTEPDFIIDETKLLRYSLLLLKNNNMENGLKILNEIPKKDISRMEETQDTTKTLYWHILNHLSINYDPNKLKTIYENLFDKNLIKPSNNILNPLIACNMSQSINAALDMYEHCCNQYKCTPFKAELIRKLILQEDAAGLQKLTDLSTSIHGEINSLYDLAFGFVESDRLKQARRIFETPGMRMRNKRLNDVSKFYVKTNQIDNLEKLIEVTKNLSHIDRMDMYENLLDYHVNNDNTEKALALWTTLQEESVAPSDHFLITLSKHLKLKNHIVPFVVPDSYKKQTTDKKTEAKIDTKASNDQFVKFNGFVEEGNFKDSEKMILNILKSNNVSISFLKYALNKFAINGKTEIFTNIEPHISNAQMKMVSFDNKKCNAFVNSGQIDSYLNDLDKKISNATEEEIESVDNSFPKGSIFNILSNKVHFDKAQNIIEKYASKGALGPMNSLWAYHLCNGNDKEASILWNKYLKTSKTIFFQSILKTASTDKDSNLLLKLVELLKTKPDITKNSLGVVYSNRLEILLSLNKHNEAYEALNDAVDTGISLNQFKKTSLVQIKTVVEETGGSFKYNL